MNEVTSKQVFCACIDRIRKRGMGITEDEVKFISMLIVSELNKYGESSFISSSVNGYGLNKQIEGELINIKISNDEVFNSENTLKIEELYMWLSLVHEYYLTNGNFTGNPYRRFVSMSMSLHRARNMPGERECVDLIKKIDKMIGYRKKEILEGKKTEMNAQDNVAENKEKDTAAEENNKPESEKTAIEEAETKIEPKAEAEEKEVKVEDEKEAEENTEENAESEAEDEISEAEDEIGDEADDDEADDNDEAEDESEAAKEAEDNADFEVEYGVEAKNNAQEIIENAEKEAEKIIREAQEKADAIINEAKSSAGKLLKSAENGAAEYLEDYVSFVRKNKKAIGAFVKTDRANVRKEVVTTRSSIEKIKQALDNTSSSFNSVENALVLISDRINDTVSDITGRLNDIASEIEYKSTENALSQFSQIYDQVSATYNAYLYGHNDDMIPKYDVLNRLLMFQEVIECCLEDYGLTSFETPVGEKLDVRIHRAKTQSYNYDPRASYVTRSLKKGFMWGDVVKVKEEVEIGSGETINADEGKDE